MLSSRDPCEVKRLVNLYRFYTFIAEESPDPEQIAILAIRWPHLTGTLASADGEQPLARLERRVKENRQDNWPRPWRRPGAGVSCGSSYAQAPNSAPARHGSPELSSGQVQWDQPEVQLRLLQEPPH